MKNDGLKAIGLTKRFGEVVAVEDLSLDVRRGEVLALLGPNGAGKTTTIRMLCGLLAPDSGRVELGGCRVAATRDARLRVGMCPQEIVVWNKLTCGEQLSYVAQLYGMRRSFVPARKGTLLRQLGLDGEEHTRASALSGGMRRRLNLALALIHDPEFVVLDEPEAGLDASGRVRVRDFLRGLARRRTVILTTHAMDEVERVADRVGIIDRGRLLAVGTPEALTSRLGAGDVLEIEVERAPHALDVPFRTRRGAIEIRALGAVRLVPRIVAQLEAAGCGVGGIRLRPNSLEDVFLELTGTGLTSGKEGLS